MKSSLLLCVAAALLLICAGCKQRNPKELKKLVAQLSSNDPATRNSAALEISNYGKDGSTAVPALIHLLNNDPSNGIKTSAAFALRKIGTPEANRALESYRK